MMNATPVLTLLHVLLSLIGIGSFLKVPVLKAFAPTQAAPPSATHLVVLVLSIVLSVFALIRFRDEPVRAR